VHRLLYAYTSTAPIATPSAAKRRNTRRAFVEPGNPRRRRKQLADDRCKHGLMPVIPLDHLPRRQPSEAQHGQSSPRDAAREPNARTLELLGPLLSPEAEAGPSGVGKARWSAASAGKVRGELEQAVRENKVGAGRCCVGRRSG
jgi:hypothetical protein